MNLHNLSALLAAMITFVIGGSVFLRDRRHRPYVTFAILCFNLCCWYLSSFFAATLKTPSIAWLSLVFGTAVPSSAERFFRTFLAEDSRKPVPRSRWILGGSVVAYLLLGYAGLFYPLHRQLAFLLPLWAFIFASLYHCVFLILRRQRATRSRPEATRLIYLFYGGVAAVSLAALDFLPRAGIAVPTLGNTLTVIYMYFISQTLFHYRLLDIKELLGKMVTLTALVLILTIIYGLLLSWVGSNRPGVFFFNTIVASFVILVIFEQLKIWVEDRVNRWMFREKYEFSRRLQLLRQELANIIEVRNVVSTVLASLEESERVTHASVYLADPSGAVFRLTGHVGPKPVDDFDATTQRLFLERLKETGLTSIEALDRQLTAQIADQQDEAAVATRNIMSTMDSLCASVCIPLILDHQILGLFNLRDDRMREAYASDELNGLRVVAAQAALTLRNSKLYEAMKERDRLAALGQMAAGLAHEIRNPLGAIKGAAQLLKSATEDLNATSSPTDAAEPAAAPCAPVGEEPRGRPCETRLAKASSHASEIDEYAGIIVEEVNRLGRVVTQFLGYARPDRAERQPLSINDVVHKFVQLLRSEAGEVELVTELAADLPQVAADPEQLRQVFFNLGINAIHAIDGKGTLTITTRVRAAPRRGAGRQQLVEVSFADTGPGIPEDKLSDIFIPFFTTKERGTGLGLPICQRIVENHNGSIEVTSQPGEGATFAVLLPAVDDHTGHLTGGLARPPRGSARKRGDARN